MDVRSRGTLSTFAGLLLASIGFTLSVLSTLLRLLLPFSSARGADAASTIRLQHDTIRKASQSKHSRRRRPLTRTHLSISSYVSASSSEESSSTTPLSSSRRHPHDNDNITRARQRSRSAERTRRRESADLEEHPDFRSRGRNISKDPQTRRRSESSPPSPSPWASFSDIARADELPLARSDSMNSHSSKHSGVHLSTFLRLKVHKTPSVPAGLAHVTKKPSPLASTNTPSYSSDLHRTKSQIFSDFLHHKRRSIHDSDKVSRRLSGMSFVSLATNEDEDSSSSPEGLDSARPSVDSHRDSRLPVPKRQQTLRTRPYEAPYFFPAPGSVEAEEYATTAAAAVAAARPRPARSGTHPPSRPHSGIF